jgi:hypothetical protein
MVLWKGWVYYRHFNHLNSKSLKFRNWWEGKAMVSNACATQKCYLASAVDIPTKGEKTPSGGEATYQADEVSPQDN